MSFEDGQGPASFEPVKIGPRRRRMDPVTIGVVVVAVALVVAIVKPWDLTGPGAVAIASPVTSPRVDSPTPAGAAPSPASTRGALVPPIWSDVVPIISKRVDWGIRTIVLGSTPDAGATSSPAASGTSSAPRYAEHWFAADVDGGEDSTAIVDERDGRIIALGVTFPPSETPLDVRIWLDHEEGELEWMDVRPVNDVPARGSYLFLRRGVEGAAVRAWAPGRYRIDVLVAGGIRRIDTLIRDRTGRLPDPAPWPMDTDPIDSSVLSTEGLPTGLFIQGSEVVTTLPAVGGPLLDQTAAWLDIDPAADLSGPRTFVARTYAPDITQVGVVVPPYSTIQTTRIRRLAPFEDAAPMIRQRVVQSLSPTSFVAFGPPAGDVWRPGVYAISVTWEDGEGPHAATWHIELRPGPLPATPLLLAATRSWAGFSGDSGVLLGVTEPLTGTDPLGVRLVDIVPQTEPGYPGLSGSDLIGCGATHVQGRPEVIGIVGPPEPELTPVASRILYPFADQGPLEVLTASGSVPGLTLLAPMVTAEFGGPASYGFRAGTGQGAPGYTICIGLPAS